MIRCRQPVLTAAGCLLHTAALVKHCAFQQRRERLRKPPARTGYADFIITSAKPTTMPARAISQPMRWARFFWAWRTGSTGFFFLTIHLALENTLPPLGAARLF